MTRETVKEVIEFNGDKFNHIVINRITSTVLDIRDCEDMIVIDEGDGDDFKDIILYVDGTKPYEVELHYESAIEVLDEKFETLEDAIQECKYAILDKDNKYFAGGVAVVRRVGDEQTLFDIDIPESYHGEPQRMTFMTCAEAEDEAENMLGEGWSTEYGRADCSTMPCPRELESWSGEIEAINVYNSWGEHVAIIGYWE